MTGRELLTFYARVKGVQHAAIPATVERLVEKLNLTKHAGKPCATYSGGNKRKLSVASALVGGPGGGTCVVCGFCAMCVVVGWVGGCLHSETPPCDSAVCACIMIDIILLDEPTTGMDPGSRRFLWNVILGLVQEGHSVVLTTHSMEEASSPPDATILHLVHNLQSRALYNILLADTVEELSLCVCCGCVSRGWYTG